MQLRNPQPLFKVFVLFFVGIGLTLVARRLGQNLFPAAVLSAATWGVVSLVAVGALVRSRRKRGWNAALFGVFAMSLGFFMATATSLLTIANVATVETRLRSGVTLAMMIAASVFAYVKDVAPQRVTSFLKLSGGVSVALLVARQFLPDPLFIPAALSMIVFFLACQVRETARVLRDYHSDELPLPAAYMLATFLFWAGFFQPL